MDDDIIRMLISSDNHLGFQEKSSVRCNDSFAAFEEVLLMAHAKKVDMVLLGGDLFHDNKPSRRTMHIAIELLRKYTLGHRQNYLEVLNSPEHPVVRTPSGQPNFRDPYTAVSVPIFAIHGNHDEPTRDGGEVSLSALDLLGGANLLNYFGKADQVDRIVIEPVLLRKRTTTVALYGLGAVADERLHRMFVQRKVVFNRPPGPFFHIFVLHQNADKGRGTKAHIDESMIPAWIDVVVWGNEHECIYDLQKSFGDDANSFRIMQPGSSVATSYNETESLHHPKHMMLFEVRMASGAHPQFRLRKDDQFRFTQYRPLLVKDVVLSKEDIDPEAHDVEERMANLLVARCQDAIRECREHASRCNNGPDALTYRMRDVSKVLVRLRVEHSGFPTLNPQRFGARFKGEIANPEGLLYFFRKRAPRSSGGVSGAKSSSAGDTGTRERRGRHGNGEEGEEGGVPTIEELVEELLSAEDKSMRVLTGPKMAEALKRFVEHKHAASISEMATEVVRKATQAIKTHAVADKDTVQERIRQLNADPNAPPPAPPAMTMGGSHDVNDEVEGDAPAPRPLPVAASSRSARVRTTRDAQPKQKTNKARTKTLRRLEAESDEEEEFNGEDSVDEEVYDDDDDNEDDDGDDDDHLTARKKKKTTTTKMTANNGKVARNKREAPVIAQLDLTGAEDVSIQASSPVKKKGRSLPNFGRRK